MSETSERDGLFDAANGQFAIGQFDEAVVLYRECVGLDDSYFDGWHALGMALLKCGEIKEASGFGWKASHLCPNDLLAWTSLSQRYVQDGQIAAAEDAKGNARILSLGGKVDRQA